LARGYARRPRLPFAAVSIQFSRIPKKLIGDRKMFKNKYRPDYKKEYPGVFISDEVLATLKKSDRKTEYLEYDLKSEKWEIDQTAQTAKCIPSREDSYERLLEEEHQFAGDGESVEDEAHKNILLEKLRLCLGQLSPNERELIDALFFSNGGSGMTEREYAVLSGIPQQTISDRKLRLLKKLKKLLEK
jgi:RNA polymerase sigma factor (sigma-70 family)